MQNIQKSFIFLLLIVSASAFTLPANAQNKAEQWLQSGTWRKNLQLQPHTSINAKTFEKEYNKHKEWWDKAFAFLNRKDLATLKDGKYPIVGDNVFAAVSSYVPVRKKDKQWEAHRKYADIQMVISGKEKIGKSNVSKLTVTKPYNSASDNENLRGKGKFYMAQPGTFFIFFPGDAHKPGIKAFKKQNKSIKKIVIKMRVN